MRPPTCPWNTAAPSVHSGGPVQPPLAGPGILTDVLTLATAHADRAVGCEARWARCRSRASVRLALLLHARTQCRTLRAMSPPARSLSKLLGLRRHELHDVGLKERAPGARTSAAVLQKKGSSHTVGSTSGCRPTSVDKTSYLISHAGLPLLPPPPHCCSPAGGIS